MREVNEADAKDYAWGVVHPRLDETCLWHAGATGMWPECMPDERFAEFCPTPTNGMCFCGRTAKLEE